MIPIFAFIFEAHAPTKPRLNFLGKILPLSSGIPTYGPSNAGDVVATFAGMVRTGEILVAQRFSSNLPKAGSTMSKLLKPL